MHFFLNVMHILTEMLRLYQLLPITPDGEIFTISMK